jgi:hypothetical protein
MGVEPTSSAERVAVIETAWPVWKTGALPLSYTRIKHGHKASFVSFSNAVYTTLQCVSHLTHSMTVLVCWAHRCLAMLSWVSRGRTCISGLRGRSPALRRSPKGTTWYGTTWYFAEGEGFEPPVCPHSKCGGSSDSPIPQRMLLTAYYFDWFLLIPGVYVLHYQTHLISCLLAQNLSHQAF